MQLYQCYNSCVGLLRATRGRGTVPAGPRKQGGFGSFRVNIWSRARRRERGGVVRRYDGNLARTASASRTDPSGHWRLLWGYREPKPQTPSSAVGVKGVIAGRARSRRETQRALSEIDTHAPRPRRNDLTPRLRLETRALKRLRSASRSVRRRDTTQSAKLEASVGRFGLCRPILIDADGTIVEGHGLSEVAKAQGFRKSPASSSTISTERSCARSASR